MGGSQEKIVKGKNFYCPLRLFYRRIMSNFLAINSYIFAINISGFRGLKPACLEPEIVQLLIKC